MKKTIYFYELKNELIGITNGSIVHDKNKYFHGYTRKNFPGREFLYNLRSTLEFYDMTKIYGEDNKLL